MSAERSNAPAFFSTMSVAATIFKHPDKPGVLVIVPHHAKDLKRGIVNSIIRQAGLTVEEFTKFL